MKTAVQIDFDGTVTQEDVSFLLLDTYADPSWRDYLEQYSAGKITVGAFSKQVFGMIKADRATMTKYVLYSPLVKVRPGFADFISYCHGRSYRTTIVSNGMKFYIEAILDKTGITGVEINAAENDFLPGRLAARYIGPDGSELDVGFKEAYTEKLKRDGCRVIYIGNGSSDIYPARKADAVFATEDLLKKCRAENLACYPFHDFTDVLQGFRDMEKRSS